MRLVIQSIGNWWNTFWFAKKHTEHLGLFRILFGGTMILMFIAFFPSWQRFFGPEADLLTSLVPGNHISLFYFSNTVTWTWVIYAVALIASLLFTFGYRTSIACVTLFIVWMSTIHHNVITVGGEARFIAMLLFFSMFAPLGASYSIDAVRKRYAFYKERSITDTYKREPQTAWAARLLQVGIAILYLFAGPTKWFSGPEWQSGTAMYYISMSDRWFRFTGLQIFQVPIVSKLLSWLAVALESLFPFLVWSKKTRLWVLGAMALMHIFILIFFSISVSFFNIISICALVLFLDPAWIRKKLQHAAPKRRPTVLYDGHCGFCRWSSTILRAMDGANQLTLRNLRDESSRTEYPDLPLTELTKELHLVTDKGEVIRGFAAYTYLTATLPVLFVLAPIFHFPGAATLGAPIYNFVSKNRFKLLPGAKNVCTDDSCGH